MADDELIAFITQAHVHKSNHKDRAMGAISFDNKFNTNLLIKSQFSKDNNKDANKLKIEKRIVTQVVGVAKLQYFAEFKKVHFNIKPLTWEYILKYCNENGLDSTKLKYSEKTMLCQNACCSPECPHFLKAKDRKIRSHMGAWQGTVPRGFHLFISDHLSLSVDEIYDQFMQERNIDLKDYKITVEDVK